MTQLLCSTSCTHSTGQQDGSGKQQCLKILFNFVLNNNKENYDDDDDDYYDEDETVRTSQSVVANGSNWRVNKQRDRETDIPTVSVEAEGRKSVEEEQSERRWGPHCVCCSFVWHWQQCVWVIFSQLVCVCAANLLPAKCFVWSFCKIYLACLPPCLVFSRAPVHSSCLATRVLVIVLATSWPKK